MLVRDFFFIGECVGMRLEREREQMELACPFGYLVSVVPYVECGVSRIKQILTKGLFLFFFYLRVCSSSNWVFWTSEISPNIPCSKK